MRVSALLGALFLACVTRLSAGDCNVLDEDTGDFYSLDALTKSGGKNHKVLAKDNRYYLLNICSPLVSETLTVAGETKKCDDGQYGCQIDSVDSKQKAKNLGKEYTLKFKDSGELEYRISGGDHCKTSDSDRSVVVLFHCNKNAGLGSPVFIEEDQSCTYLFNWESSAACPQTTATPSPIEPQHCMVVDGNNRFDLTALAKPKGNWVVNEGQYKFLLNVCAPVNGNAKCAGHGACQTMPSDSNFNKPMGLATARPKLVDGVLTLTMTGGKSCHNGTYDRQTTIVFSCKEGSESLGHPVYIEETDECEYIFSWETSLACADSVNTTCQISDPVTKKEVDLSSLTKTSGSNIQATSAVVDDHATYKINICGDLLPNDNPCRGGTSICRVLQGEKTGVSLGSHGTLTVNDNVVVMEYADGDMCPGTNERITSDIYFICDPVASKSTTPTLVSKKSDCQYLFTWKTQAACESSSSPINKKLSTGSIIFIVLVTLVGAYLMGGVAYNRFVRGEKGMDQIPHYGLCQACYYTVAERFSSRRGGGAGSIQL